jgi:broad-specificity NMP kinase
MKIILLSGKPGTGKSTTFNLLYDKIIEEERPETIPIKKELGNKKNKDFECVVNYKGKKVALYSMGDYDINCIEAIIKHLDCDVLVLAYSEEHHCIIKKSEAEVKSNTDDCKAKNEDDCKRIIEELKR